MVYMLKYLRIMGGGKVETSLHPLRACWQDNALIHDHSVRLSSAERTAHCSCWFRPPMRSSSVPL